jgi:hypothetical protein
MEGKISGLRGLEGGKVGVTSQPYKPRNHDVLRGDSPGHKAWSHGRRLQEEPNPLSPFRHFGTQEIERLRTLQPESRSPES